MGLLAWPAMVNNGYNKQFASGVVAAGFRVGEPGGFMARKYSANGINAIEVNIGTYGGLWGTDRNYKDGEFRNIGYSINMLYLWHFPTLVNADLHTYSLVSSRFSRVFLV